MDWKDLAGTLIRSGAPIIGTALGGPLGGTIGSVAGKVIADALGVEPTPEAVEYAVTSRPPEMVAAQLAVADGRYEAIARVFEAQAKSHTEIVASLSEEYKAALADNEAARQHEMELAKIESPLQWGAPVISVVVAAGFFTLLIILMVRPIAVDPSVRDVLLIMIGSIGTAFGQVVSYYVGSSAGSKEKDQAMKMALAGSQANVSKALTPEVPTTLVKPAVKR